MMDRDERAVEDLLLDWHLDQLDDSDTAWVEDELHRNVELRAKSDRLGRILQPLDAWTLTSAPVGLADRILQRTSGAADSCDTPSPTLPQQERRRGRLTTIAIRDVLAVAACLLLLAGVMVPGISKLRNYSRRVDCASNLRSIYDGMFLYQQAFQDSLPYAGGVPDSVWLPSASANAPYASNSRHAYLLLKTNFVPEAESFVCPARDGAVPMHVRDRRAYDDFASARNISYSTISLCGPKPLLRPRSTIVYAADANPLFEGGRFDPAVDAEVANSRTHARSGESVLSTDGTVEWLTSPKFGPEEDNIWVLRGVRQYTGAEAQASEDDIFLVPGYPAGAGEASGIVGN